jgi:hypothetical protein
MKKTVLTFGAISGIVTSILMLSILPFIDRLGFDKGTIVGYTAMLVSFVFIFPGIRSYRENIGNGTISFGRAFTVGILITLISGVFYVLTWQLIYYKLAPEIHDKLINYLMEKTRNSGRGPAEVAAELESIRQFSQSIRNPFINAAYTFLEPLPVGLLVTLISSTILRKKAKAIGSTEVVTTTV